MRTTRPRHLTLLPLHPVRPARPAPPPAPEHESATTNWLSALLADASPEAAAEALASMTSRRLPRARA